MKVLPPDRPGPKFIPRQAVIGLVGGIAIGIVAKICGESAWYWLAVVIAPLWFGFDRSEPSPPPAPTRRPHVDRTSAPTTQPQASESASLAGHSNAAPAAPRREAQARERATIEEFQERRLECWRRIRPSLIAMVAGFAILFFYCGGVHGTDDRFLVCAAAFAGVAIAIVHMTWTWKRFYRCPECEEPLKMPFSQGGDVPLNPRTCPNCGARLA
jgi:hypothetical protein